MKDVVFGLDILDDAALRRIVGGAGGSDAPKDWTKQEKEMMGAAITGAMMGAYDGAPGGPFGIAGGALAGAAFGIGCYMANAYATGGDRSKIPACGGNKLGGNPPWDTVRQTYSSH
jgi:hypothetical protein